MSAELIVTRPSVSINSWVMLKRSRATGELAVLLDTPQQAADALVEAADKFDVVALSHIFGPGGEGVVFRGEFAQDRKHAADFAAEAREKKSVSVDPKGGNRAFLLVGSEDWPFPVPNRGQYLLCPPDGVLDGTDRGRDLLRRDLRESLLNLAQLERRLREDAKKSEENK